MKWVYVILHYLVQHLEMRQVSLKSKISCNWTEQWRIRKFEILSLVWWSEFRMTELFVVSWEKGTPAVPDDTLSMVLSCSDLSILGDVRACILADLRKCYCEDDVIGDKMSTSSDIDPVVVKIIWIYQTGIQNPYIEEKQTPNGQKKKDQRTKNNLQNIHIKLKIE